MINNLLTIANHNLIYSLSYYLGIGVDGVVGVLVLFTGYT